MLFLDLVRLGMETELRRAAGRGELRLAYPPVVSLAEGGGVVGSRRCCAWWPRGWRPRASSRSCELAQGFLFAPPLDAADADRLLEEDPRW